MSSGLTGKIWEGRERSPRRQFEQVGARHKSRNRMLRLKLHDKTTPIEPWTAYDEEFEPSAESFSESMIRWINLPQEVAHVLPRSGIRFRRHARRQRRCPSRVEMALE